MIPKNWAPHPVASLHHADALAVGVPNTPEPIRDLIETRSAQHLIPKLKLWKLVFAAILAGDLPPPLPADTLLDTKFDHGGMRLTWRCVIAGDLRTLECRNIDPSDWPHTAGLSYFPATFDRWLKAAMVADRFPARPKRRAGAKAAKREAVRNFIEHLSEGVSNKEVVRLVKDELGIDVSERTVRRARGRS